MVLGVKSELMLVRSVSVDCTSQELVASKDWFEIKMWSIASSSGE